MLVSRPDKCDSDGQSMVEQMDIDRGLRQLLHQTQAALREGTCVSCMDSFCDMIECMHTMVV